MKISWFSSCFHGFLVCFQAALRLRHRRLGRRARGLALKAELLQRQRFCGAPCLLGVLGTYESRLLWSLFYHASFNDYCFFCLSFLSCFIMFDLFLSLFSWTSGPLGWLCHWHVLWISTELEVGAIRDRPSGWKGPRAVPVQSGDASSWQENGFFFSKTP